MNDNEKKRILYAVIVAYLVSIVLTTVNILYTNNVDRDARDDLHDFVVRNNQQWCGLLVGIDDAYQKTPPTTLAGKNFAAAVHVVRINFDCE
jgi:hypothetical protein